MVAAAIYSDVNCEDYISHVPSPQFRHSPSVRRLAARVEHGTTGCDKDYAATGGEGYSIPGKRGEVLKDEIAQVIVSELRLIREELQNLTMAVRSASTSRNSENSYTGKPPKFYPRRAANPPDARHSQGHKPPRSPQRGQPRSQWHQNAPKDTR